MQAAIEALARYLSEDASKFELVPIVKVVVDFMGEYEAARKELELRQRRQQQAAAAPAAPAPRS
jgi:hypothetical protein